MTQVRARIVRLAIVVLVCQAAGLSAAPVALCRGALSVTDLDACCKDLKPGQTCPMHHTTHRSEDGRGPAWTCLCSPSDAVLASIVGVSGALPEPIRVPDPIRCVARVVSASSSTLDRQPPPPYQPPRVSSRFRLVVARSF